MKGRSPRCPKEPRTTQKTILGQKIRCGWESNPRIRVLQTLALPLGHRTVKRYIYYSKKRIFSEKSPVLSSGKENFKKGLDFFSFYFILLLREAKRGPIFWVMSRDGARLPFLFVCKNSLSAGPVFLYNNKVTRRSHAKAFPQKLYFCII